MGVYKVVHYDVNGAEISDASLAKEAAIKPFTDLLDKCVASPKERLDVFNELLNNPKIYLGALQTLLQLYDLLKED